MLRLNDRDEAFRALCLLMGEDRNYGAAPLALIAPRLWSAISRDHYWLLACGNQPMGCVLWGEMQAATLAASLRRHCEPTGQQLQDRGEAVIALALVAKSASMVSNLWRQFVRNNHHRPVLAIRHFGRHNQQPRFLLYLNGHVCNEEQLQQWLLLHPERSGDSNAVSGPH